MKRLSWNRVTPIDTILMDNTDVTWEEVETAVSKVGAAVNDNIVAQHLKNGGEVMVDWLTELIMVPRHGMWCSMTWGSPDVSDEMPLWPHPNRMRNTIILKKPLSYQWWTSCYSKDFNSYMCWGCQPNIPRGSSCDADWVGGRDCQVEHLCMHWCELLSDDLKDVPRCSPGQSSVVSQQST